MQVVPFPLGTGNDMSRVLGWGANYAGESVSPILQDIENGLPVKMDRWTITSEPLSDSDFLCLQTLLASCAHLGEASEHSGSKPSSDHILEGRLGPSASEMTTRRKSLSFSDDSHIIIPPSTPPPQWIPKLKEHSRTSTDTSGVVEKPSSRSRSKKKVSTKVEHVALTDELIAATPSAIPYEDSTAVLDSTTSTLSTNSGDIAVIEAIEIIESTSRDLSTEECHSPSAEEQERLHKEVINVEDDQYGVLETVERSIDALMDSQEAEFVEDDDSRREMDHDPTKNAKVMRNEADTLSPMKFNPVEEIASPQLITPPIVGKERRRKAKSKSHDAADTSITSPRRSRKGRSTSSRSKRRIVILQENENGETEVSTYSSTLDVESTDVQSLSFSTSCLPLFDPITSLKSSGSFSELADDAASTSSATGGQEASATSSIPSNSPKSPSRRSKRRKVDSSSAASTSSIGFENVGAEGSPPRGLEKPLRNSAPVFTIEGELEVTHEPPLQLLNDETLPEPTLLNFPPTPLCHFGRAESTSALSPSRERQAEYRRVVMNNYFSIGVDSMVALDFHIRREASPGLFPHHVINKAWYGIYGIKHAMLNLSKKPDLRRVVRLELDGKEVTIPRGVEALVFLQIPSYSSGTNLWGDPTKWKGQRSAPSIGDGVFEVVALNGVMHLGALQAGWRSGIRIGQAHHAVLYVVSVVPVQCDGEPWLMPPCKTTIEFRNQSTMLYNLSKTSPHRYTTVTGLLPPGMIEPEAPPMGTLTTVRVKKTKRRPSSSPSSDQELEEREVASEPIPSSSNASNTLAPITPMELRSHIRTKPNFLYTNPRLHQSHDELPLRVLRNKNCITKTQIGGETENPLPDSPRDHREEIFELPPASSSSTSSTASCSHKSS